MAVAWVNFCGGTESHAAKSQATQPAPDIGNAASLPFPLHFYNKQAILL